MNTNKKISVAVSGYFDPIHVGHLEYLKMAKELGDFLIVIVNNNQQCILKKGKPFMDENDRVEILRALGIVDCEPELKAKSAKTAMLFSRTNTLLSLPMLLSMVAAQNLY